MAASPTSIANGALLANGQETLGSLDDNDPNAVKIRAIYDLVLKELQAEDWFFTRTRVELTQLAAEPTFGSYDYQYSLPPDFCANLVLVDEDFESIKYRFTREGQNILTNREEGFLKYNKLVEEVGYFPPWFLSLFEAKLAYKLAPKLVKDETIVTRLKDDLDEAWNDARSGNSQDDYFEDAHGDTDGNTDWSRGQRTDII